MGVDWLKLRPDRISMVRKAFDKLVADIVEQEGFSDALGQVAFLGVSQGAIMALVRLRQEDGKSGLWYRSLVCCRSRLFRPRQGCRFC